jgi:hypothetical protein
MTGAIETLANQKAKSTFAEDLLELVRRYAEMNISDEGEKKKDELQGNEGKEEVKMDVEGVEAREREKIEKKMEVDEEKMESEDGWENVRSDGEDEREWEMVNATTFSNLVSSKTLQRHSH